MTRPIGPTGRLRKSEDHPKANEGPRDFAALFVCFALPITTATPPTPAPLQGANSKTQDAMIVRTWGAARLRTYNSETRLRERKPSYFTQDYLFLES